MYLEANSLCAGEVALFTNGRFLSTVNQHVHLHMISFDAWVSTLVASLNLLSTMLKHVHFEVPFHLKRKIALNTGCLQSAIPLYNLGSASIA